jgi:hypothetical protein
MRIIGAAALAAVILGGAAGAVAYAHTQSSDSATAPATSMSMKMPMDGSTNDSGLPAVQLARLRLATAKYATSLDAAKADGYSILTRQIPGMGYHFINPAITGFDVTRPPILVYEKHGSTWQLGAAEWVFPSTPTTPPLKGATYGSFPAACHYRDGTFTPEPSANDCPATSPQTGAAFNFWHPQLVTLHVWIWYPNPAGLYASMNPLVDSFD